MKKRGSRVVLFASIERAQHDALRYIAYKERRSIADVTRHALNNYIEQKSSEYGTDRLQPSAVQILEAKASALVME